jgi:Arc/MetJ family transcription regulator
MRTNIEIDDKLLAQAMRGHGAKTKRETVDAALKMLVRIQGQAGIRKLRGKVKWEGNFEQSRVGRFHD